MANTGETNVYAIMLDWPDSNKLTLGMPVTTASTQVSMLGYSGTISFTRSSQRQMVISLPVIPFNKMPCLAAWVFKLQGLVNA